MKKDEALKKYLDENSLKNEDNILVLFKLTLMEDQRVDCNNSFSRGVVKSLIDSIFYSDGWINSNGKSDPTPDYYNPSRKMMMEVMTISHYQYEKNGNKYDPDFKGVAKCIEELYSTDSELCKRFFELNNVVKAINENDPDRIHSYQQYLDSFRRVVGHHIDEIKTYRRNHPGYKLVFLINDESTPYYIVNEKKVGDTRIYQPIYDESFNSIIRNADIDYVIWFTPYRITPDGNYPAQIFVCDPHCLMETASYSSEDLIPLEPADGKPTLPMFIWWTDDEKGLHRNIMWG
jgi:hypothetical protein